MKNRVVTLRSKSMSINMVSVGPNTPSRPSRPNSFIISPSITSAEDEMLILQNFNQIQHGGQSKLGIIGTQELYENHKKMVELLAYALVLSGNHIFTSGGGNGTNFAVIKGALRACNPDLLTVILPQSLYKQPSETQPLLQRVSNLIESPQNDEMEFKTAASICNDRIIEAVDRLLVFAFHSSNTVLDAVNTVKDTKEVTIFYLD